MLKPLHPYGFFFDDYGIRHYFALSCTPGSYQLNLVKNFLCGCYPTPKFNILPFRGFFSRLIVRVKNLFCAEKTYRNPTKKGKIFWFKICLECWFGTD